MAQKRKADGITVSSNPGVGATGAPTSTASPASLTPTSANNGIVLSAAADMYPQAQAANASAENPDDKPKPKFKKIKATKELEKGKNKWQEFTAKGKFGKAAKKDSMFRTPEGVHGRGQYCAS
jgi:survival-of-motor-neuron-related-splicing factor 30